MQLPCAGGQLAQPGKPFCHNPGIGGQKLGSPAHFATLGNSPPGKYQSTRKRQQNETFTSQFQRRTHGRKSPRRILASALGPDGLEQNQRGNIRQKVDL
jgi:hypothetical protein